MDHHTYDSSFPTVKELNENIRAHSPIIGTTYRRKWENACR